MQIHTLDLSSHQFYFADNGPSHFDGADREEVGTHTLAQWRRPSSTTRQRPSLTDALTRLSCNDYNKIQRRPSSPTHRSDLRPVESTLNSTVHHAYFKHTLITYTKATHLHFNSLQRLYPIQLKQLRQNTSQSNKTRHKQQRPTWRL